MRRTFIVPLLLTLCGVLLLSACSENKQAPLRIAANNWPGYWPLFLAQAEGQLGAHLQELSSATEVLRAFRNNNIDVAALTGEEFLQLLDEGNEPQIAMTLDYSNGADTLLARASIKTVADLRGKVIGAERTATGAYLLHRALASAELAPNDVTIAAYALSEHEAVFLRGKVDAIVTFEPVRSRLLASGARELFNSARIPGEILDVLVVSRDLARHHGPQLRKLIDTWHAAAARMQAEPATAAKRLEFMAQLMPPQFAQAMAGIHLITREENQRLLKGELAKTLARLSTLMHATATLSRAMPDEEIQKHIGGWGIE